MKLSFHGIFLTGEDRYYLQSVMSNLIPEGWKVKCHHATIAHQSDLGRSTPWVKRYVEDWVETRKNTTEILIATHFGQNENSIALKVVSPSFPCLSGVPHITVAISPNGKSSDSRLITDWLPLKNRIQLVGLVGSVLE